MRTGWEKDGGVARMDKDKRVVGARRMRQGWGHDHAII